MDEILVCMGKRVGSTVSGIIDGHFGAIRKNQQGEAGHGNHTTMHTTTRTVPSVVHQTDGPLFLILEARPS